MNNRKPAIAGYDAVLQKKPLGGQSVTDVCENQPLDERVDAGVCTIEGKRPSQEDTFVIDVSESTAQFAGFNKQQQDKIMQRVFALLQDKCGLMGNRPEFVQEVGSVVDVEAGSCACVATGLRQNGQVVVSTSYVGDSAAFLIVMDNEGNLKPNHAIACNTSLHETENDNECAAIKNGRGRKTGIIDHRGRLGGGITITRAIGDNAFVDCGLLHEPETTRQLLKLDPDDKAFMVVGCDGMMDHHNGKEMAKKMAIELGVLIPRKLKEDRKKNVVSTSAEIANFIVNHAFIKGSADNITVLVIPLLQDKPVTAAVFDGHNGAHVAVGLKQYFSACFSEVVTAYVNEIKNAAGAATSTTFTGRGRRHST